MVKLKICEKARKNTQDCGRQLHEEEFCENNICQQHIPAVRFVDYYDVRGTNISDYYAEFLCKSPLKFFENTNTVCTSPPKKKKFKKENTLTHREVCFFLSSEEREREKL